MNLERPKSIFLADDDIDDCALFEEALATVPLLTDLTQVYDGVELMQLLLKESGQLPSLLFLDLNMPFKNGIQCLEEISQHDRLKQIGIIILSTSFDQSMANHLFSLGAKHYIRKPNTFSVFKAVIHKVLMMHDEGGPSYSPNSEESKYMYSAKSQ